MHAIAHEGCTDTVRERALKVDSGTKSLAASGNRTCPSACRFDGLPTELYPRPIRHPRPPFGGNTTKLPLFRGKMKRRPCSLQKHTMKPANLQFDSVRSRCFLVSLIVPVPQTSPQTSWQFINLDGTWKNVQEDVPDVKRNLHNTPLRFLPPLPRLPRRQVWALPPFVDESCLLAGFSGPHVERRF